MLSKSLPLFYFAPGDCVHPTFRSVTPMSTFLKYRRHFQNINNVFKIVKIPHFENSSLSSFFLRLTKFPRFPSRFCFSGHTAIVNSTLSPAKTSEFLKMASPLGFSSTAQARKLPDNRRFYQPIKPSFFKLETEQRAFIH